MNRSVYSVSVSIPTNRIRKHKKVKIYKTNSELGNKVLNCPVGASFAIANDSERTNTFNWARQFNMKFTVRNTAHDTYKRAFRIA
jgi:hypothetical protein